MRELGQAVGLSKSAIAKIENEEVKNPLAPRLLIRLADALRDPDLLAHHCRFCPVRRTLMERYFPELTGIAGRQAAILDRLRSELQIQENLVGSLIEKISDGGPGEVAPIGCRDIQRKILAIRRRWETLEFQLLVSDLADD